MKHPLGKYVRAEDYKKPELELTIDIIGIDNYIKLATGMFGNNIYVPDLKNNSFAVKRYIKDGRMKLHPHKISRDLGLSLPHINKLIAQIKKDEHND